MVLVAALAAFYNYSNYTIEVEHAEFHSRRIPALFDDYRIVQISDLHGAEFGERNEKLLSEVKKAEPDCIVITGDLVDRFRGADFGAVKELMTGTEFELEAGGLEAALERGELWIFVKR